MCGRFVSALPPEELARIFAIAGPLPNAAPTWNLAPTQSAVVVRRNPETGERALSLLRWGLFPSFAKDPKATRPFNARAESVATNGMFRGAFAKRRCLVPADAYYEWHATPAGKIPYAIAGTDGLPLALGGIWEGHRAPDGEITRSFAIVTTAANTALAHLHPRMPLVVAHADWPAWLGEAEADATRLLRAAPEAALKAWRIGTAVNSVRNNTPELLWPATPQAGDTLSPPEASGTLTL